MTVISYENFRNFSVPDPWNKNLEIYRQEKLSYKNKDKIYEIDYFPCTHCDNSGKEIIDRDYDPCGRTDCTYGVCRVCNGSGTVDKSKFKLYYQNAKKQHDDYRKKQILFIEKMESILSKITKEEYSFLTSLNDKACGYHMDLTRLKVKKKKTPFMKYNKSIKTKLQDSLLAFFKHNRRQGSSTALLQAAQKDRGIILVDTESTAQLMLEKAKVLFGENTPINFKVITIYQIKNGVDRGIDPQKVFVDISAFWPFFK